MPQPTPFHARTSELCISYRWKDWAGYASVCRYGLSPEREYNAIRQAAALIDVTPLFKYDVAGPDAGRFLSRVLSRDVTKLKPGRVTYLCWVDDHGHVLDDGTCARLGPETYRVTAAAPSYRWLALHAEPHEVEIVDTSATLAALALQGPTSADVLRQMCDADLGALRFFGITATRFGGTIDGWLTRTGYTGDLGYELWVQNEDALATWDLVMACGKAWGIEPVGLDALDVSRIEAGFIMQGVDYFSAHDAVIPSQKSTPYELGLGWTVKLDRSPFIGQAALREEQQRGSTWAMVGLELDWGAIERLHERYGLPPGMPPTASRDGVPVYVGRRQVGYATSRTWSPILKKPLALATVRAEHASPGSRLDVEVTVEYERRRVPARVTATPFFDPERKRA
jgi:aminomethyltransferase